MDHQGAGTRRGAYAVAQEIKLLLQCWAPHCGAPWSPGILWCPLESQQPGFPLSFLLMHLEVKEDGPSAWGPTPHRSQGRPRAASSWLDSAWLIPHSCSHFKNEQMICASVFITLSFKLISLTKREIKTGIWFFTLIAVKLFDSILKSMKFKNT